MSVKIAVSAYNLLLVIP